MSLTTASRQPSKRTHGADATLLTGSGYQSDSRAMSLGARSDTRIAGDGDSQRSNSFSVDLGDDGEAPAPPDFTRRQHPMHGGGVQ